MLFHSQKLQLGNCSLASEHFCSVPALADEADKVLSGTSIPSSNNLQEMLSASIRLKPEFLTFLSLGAKQAFLYDYIRPYFSALEEENPFNFLNASAA